MAMQPYGKTPIHYLDVPKLRKFLAKSCSYILQHPNLLLQFSKLPALRAVHTEKRQKRKRKFSLMFVAYSLTFWIIILIFLAFALTYARR